MKYRSLGRTGFDIASVGFGAWAIGGSWGPVADEASLAALGRALELGINFFDTADVYGEGHSERLLARLKRERTEPFYIATKVGRGTNQHIPTSYTRENLTSYVERSLRNLETEALDLLQLHCPPTDVYYMPEVFDVLDDLTRAGKLRFYGVSVERVEEGLKALEYPNVQTIQIVYNIFRQRPAELLFEQAARRQVGIVARLPLSSGLLTGKFRPDTEFAPDDHRSFNRQGAAFDRGETFSGVDYDVALRVVDELRPLVAPGRSLAELAIAWILQNPIVTTTIPGARKPEQVEQNAAAADYPQLSAETLERISGIYREHLRPLVHQRW
jgi:aryl-alcohol dehydrogenase-like predicted oxidoreductase